MVVAVSVRLDFIETCIVFNTFQHKNDFLWEFGSREEIIVLESLTAAVHRLTVVICEWVISKVYIINIKMYSRQAFIFIQKVLEHMSL